MVWILSPSLPVEIRLKFVESTIEKRKSIQKYGSNQQIQQINATETTARYSTVTSSEQSLRTLFVPWRRAYTSFEKKYKKCEFGSTLPRTFQHEIKQKIKLVFRKTEPFGYTFNGTTRSSNTNKSYLKLPVSTVMGMPGVSTGPWLVLTSVCIA